MLTLVLARLTRVRPSVATDGCTVLLFLTMRPGVSVTRQRSIMLPGLVVLTGRAS